MSPRRRIIPLFVPHLGCPHQCVFCNQREISGAVKPADGKTVSQALESAAALGLKPEEAELAFYGGSFTAIEPALRRELLEAAQGFVRAGGRIRLSTRPDAISPAILQELKAAGVFTIELGCQSMDEQVLRLSGRGHDAACVRTSAALIRQAGFELILQMMTGLPGDSREKALQTARQLAELQPHGVRIYPTVLIRDTPLHDLWQQGLYREHTVAEAVDWCTELMDAFDAAGIPVIRLGLNPSDELSGGLAAGGAYHPAFGELVESARYLKKEQALLQQLPAGSRVTLLVSPSCLSAAVGHKKSNRLALGRLFPGLQLTFRPCPGLEKGEIAIEMEGGICYN